MGNELTGKLKASFKGEETPVDSPAAQPEHDSDEGSDAEPLPPLQQQWQDLLGHATDDWPVAGSADNLIEQAACVLGYNDEFVELMTDALPIDEGEGTVAGSQSAERAIVSETAREALKRKSIAPDMVPETSSSFTGTGQAATIIGAGETSPSTEHAAGHPLKLTASTAIDRRYMLGAEVALAAVIASAAVAHRRTQIRITEHDGGRLAALDKMPPEDDSAAATGKREGTNLPDWGSGKENLVRHHKAAPRRPTVVVSPADTLASIAEAYFHNATLAWLIADLNACNFKQTWIDGKCVVELKSRQQLVLPVAEDISRFLENRPCHLSPENLITIVVATQLDKESLSLSLGKCMGVSSTNSCPFDKAVLPDRASQTGLPDRRKWNFSRYFSPGSSNG